MAQDDAFVGTELKYSVNITAVGFSVEDDEFEIDLVRGPNRLHFEKSDLPSDANGQYYICFDSKALGSGLVKCIVTAHVPDDDFDDGIRDEVYAFPLVNLKSTK